MVDFLKAGIKMMNEESTRELLKSPSCKKPGQKLISLQRDGWDVLGFDQETACKELDSQDPEASGDMEFHNLKDEFCNTAFRTFLRALEDRRPAKLETARPMPRDVLIEFFDACNTKMDLPETQEALLKHMEEKQEIPNAVIIETQRDLLEVVGWEREHGCQCLNKISQDYPNDKELFGRMSFWQKKAHTTCAMAVQEHQAQGGPVGLLPSIPGLDTEDMKRVGQMAKASVEKMTPEERQAHLKLMEKKVKVFMNLPQQGRIQYLQKLSEPDKLEFVKAQLLLLNVMREHATAQEAQEKAAQAAGGTMAQAPGAQSMDGSTGGGYGNAAAVPTAPAQALKPSPGPAVNKPRQQEMM